MEKETITLPNILSAGVVITRGIGPSRIYLLLRAYGNWDFPKGIVEPGEDPLAAAIREVEEETSISDLRFHRGYDYCETAPYGRGKVARYYLAESARDAVYLPISPELGYPEHEEFQWANYQTARSLLPERLWSILDWAEQRSSQDSRTPRHAE